MRHAMLWLLRSIGRLALGIVERVFYALMVICAIGGIWAWANYNLTQGAGTTFGSIVVAGTHYAQQFICDLTTPAQCAAVSAGGAVKVDNSGVTQPISGNVGQSGTWTVQPGNTANTTPWLASINQGGNTALVKAGNTAATTDNAVEVADANLLNAINAATPAGEFHIGEVGGNQIRVQVAQTVTSGSAYASGNAVGGLMTIANATRVSGALGAGGTGGILQNVAVNSKSVQTAQMDIFIFDANPSGSTCTDKTAFVLATADFDKVIGVASVPSTAANNSGWFSGGTGSVGQANNQAMAFNLSSATSLFACMVTRGTPTFTATTDISVKYQILRD